MDRELVERIRSMEATSGDKCACIVRFDTPDHVELEAGADRVVVGLKPLEQLYGSGPGKATIDPEDDDYTPLFQGIERTVCELRPDPDFTDGEVLVAYRALAMNPEKPSGGGPLAIMLQLQLRLMLSGLDYSRNDVQRVFKRLARSVEFHMADGGRGAYLDFISEFFEPD